MAEGRLRYYLDGKFKKVPEYTCLTSSADSPWSGFLVECQKCYAGRLSESVCVYNPRLLVVKRGELTCTWREGGRQYKDHRKPGTVIFIDRGHQLDDVVFDASWEHLAIELAESKRDKWTRGDDFPTTALLPHVIADDTRIANLAQCMYEEILGGCSSGKLYGESLSLALMSYAWERYASSRPPVRSMQSGLSTPKLRRLLDYILAHLASNLALDDLAELVDLSPRHLCRSFKQATYVSLPIRRKGTNREIEGAPQNGEHLDCTGRSVGRVFEPKPFCGRFPQAYQHNAWTILEAFQLVSCDKRDLPIDNEA